VGEGAVKKDRRRGSGGEGVLTENRRYGREGEGVAVLKADRRRRASGAESVKDDRRRGRGAGGVVVVRDDRHDDAGRKSRRRGTAPEAGTAGPPRENRPGEAPDPPPDIEIDAAAGPGDRGQRERIRTEAGRYLRAIADDTDARLGTAGGQVDDETRRVWAAAFGLAARRRFDPDAPLAEISRTVATAVHEHAAVALPPLETEMLVRAALGERVPVDEIGPTVLTAVHLLLFVSLTDELALAGPELDTLIAEAEAEAEAEARVPGTRA